MATNGCPNTQNQLLAVSACSSMARGQPSMTYLRCMSARKSSWPTPTTNRNARGMKPDICR
eukprot:12923658-Alexandrium_andersonii.AAC.1